jgi:cytochrome c-type biogenesis protein CcmH
MDTMPIERNNSTVKELLTITFIAVLFLIVTGCTSNSKSLSPDELETMAQGIDKGLMCPVCPSETIDQSQVQIAKQMQIIVREKLAEGSSRDTIFQFFTDRYGARILAEPPKSGFNLLVWVMPPMALLVGSGILIMIVLAMRREHHGEAPKKLPAASADIEPYLSAVDQEIRRLTQWSTSNNAKDLPPPQSAKGNVE